MEQRICIVNKRQKPLSSLASAVLDLCTVRAFSVIVTASHAAMAAGAPLTLEDAWRIAEAANPQLRAARSESYAVQGRLTESRALLFNNPAASVENWRGKAPRPEDSERDWQLGVSQSFEIAGQQKRRRQAAQSEVEAVDANIGEIRAQVRAEVEQRFVQVLALQLRYTVEGETMALVEQAADAVRKRLDAGQVSRLDANLAKVEAERARNILSQVADQLTQARAELAAVLQLAPGESPEVSGDLRRGGNYDLRDLLDAASRRQRLVSLTRREEAARSRLELERAARYPDVTLGVFAGREGPPDLRQDMLGFSVSVPLPVFRRNEAGVGRALTELTQAQLERQTAERDTAAGVRAQWQRLAQIQARADRLRDMVLPALEDNLRLSQIAYREGELGIAEVLLVNRQVAEARREALDADAELRRARIELERIAGWVPAEPAAMRQGK